MNDVDSAELIERWQSGDQLAAGELFQRYAARLIALVRVRLAEKMKHRFDAEDVVQSAFRSFFVGAREGRYLLSHSGDVWSLLVAITLHKLRHKVAQNLAQKRAVTDELLMGIDLQVARDQMTKTPRVEDVAAVADEIERIMARLKPLEQRMFELRLEGHTLDEVAADTQRSQRTVRRVMERIKTEIAETEGRRAET